MKNGHVVHMTLLGTPGYMQKLRQLWKVGARDITVGVPVGTQLPNSLQILQEKETQDPTGRSALYINRAAIPAGIGLYIGVDVASSDNFNFGEDLVVASKECTGL